LSSVVLDVAVVVVADAFTGDAVVLVDVVVVVSVVGDTGDVGVVVLNPLHRRRMLLFPAL